MYKYDWKIKKFAALKKKKTTFIFKVIKKAADWKPRKGLGRARIYSFVKRNETRSRSREWIYNENSEPKVNVNGT